MTRVLYWVLTAATVGVYLVMVLWSLPRITEAAGGLMPFDLRPWGYTPDEAQAFLAALPDTARDFYAGVQHRLDLAFPVLLTLWICASGAKLFRGGWLLALCAVAIVGMVADLSENVAVARLLTEFDPDTALMAARWTVIKSAASTISLTALLAGFILWLRRRR